MSDIKTFYDLARLVDAEKRAEEAELKRERTEKRTTRHDECVVDGAFRPKPIDRAAAMLIARAPWWAHAPEINKGDRHAKDQIADWESTRRYNKTEELAIQRKKQSPKAGGSQRVLRDANAGKDWRLPMSEINNDNSPLLKGMTLKCATSDGRYSLDELASEMVLAIQRNAPKELSDLARLAVDSRKVLQESTENIGEIVNDFDRITKSAQQSIRSSRMNIVSECAHVVGALKDVRQFFLGPDYEREQKRLSDFVDLCERLKVLKDSGFLDTVADTMLRLAARDE